VSLQTKYTGLILASGELVGDPTIPVLEALSPFQVSILQSSLLTIRDRYVFSLLIELIPDHRDAIATDLDQLSSSGVTDIAYDFATFLPNTSKPELFHGTIVAAKIPPSALLPLHQLIAQYGKLENFTLEQRETVAVAKISFASESNLQELKGKFAHIAEEHQISFNLENSSERTLGGDACLLDMDSTFINEEVIDLLADIAGVGDEVSGITERAMKGELDFPQSLRARVALLKGQPESIFELARSRISATNGAKEFVSSLHKRGSRVGIVSGGFHEVIDKFLEPFNLDFILANRFEIEHGVLTGEILGAIVDRERKAVALHEFSLGAQRSIAIGDGANDIDMVKSANLGIAFMAKPALAEVADTSIFVRDLRAALPLLGY
jgi:phosphoserine phosphatase